MWALLLCWSLRAASMDATIAVAANFRDAATSIAEYLESISDHRYQVVSGSTGKLASQIIAGAPFDVLMAADQRRPSLLIERGLAVPDTLSTYAVGELGLWWPNASTPLTVAALATLPPHRVCIANPAIAPYGEAARAVLSRAGFDESWLQGLVRVDNVNAVAGMVASAQVTAGFIARASVTLSERHAGIEIDEQDVIWLQDYPPIKQDLVLLTRANDNPAARFWVVQLQDPAVRQLIRAHGYQLLSELVAP